MSIPLWSALYNIYHLPAINLNACFLPSSFSSLQVTFLSVFHYFSISCFSSTEGCSACPSGKWHLTCRLPLGKANQVKFFPRCFCRTWIDFPSLVSVAPRLPVSVVGSFLSVEDPTTRPIFPDAFPRDRRISLPVLWKADYKL